MKEHKGMRPQDIVILLKIAVMDNQDWYMKDLAYELGISQSEVSESLNRSSKAGLLSADKRKLMKSAILDFIQYGLRYVYPQKPGAIVRGLLTAHSAPPLNKDISSEELYVWPWAEGKDRGQGIEPLHPSVPEACKKDKRLYELMTLVEAIRLGKVREQNLAITAIKTRL